MIMRLRDGRVLASTTSWQRRIARALLDRGPDFGLLAFRLADTHLHAAAICNRRNAAELCRRAEISLTRRRREYPGFSTLFVKPIQDQRHLTNLFAYILNQHTHHGIDTDPRHEASTLPDLLGLRITGASTIQTTRTVLPRVNRAQLLRAMGIDRLDPADGPLDWLPDAAAAAVCLPHLRCREPGSPTLIQAARTAAVHVAGDRAPTTHLADLLDVSPRTIRRMRSQEPDQRLREAIRLQLGLRSANRTRVMPP